MIAPDGFGPLPDAWNVEKGLERTEGGKPRKDEGAKNEGPASKPSREPYVAPYLRTGDRT